MTTKALNALFGTPYTSRLRPNPAWQEANLVYIDLPYTMRIAWDTTQRVKRIRVHRLLVDDFKKAFSNVWAEARSQVKEKYGYELSSAFYDSKTAALLRALGLDLYGGTYEFRLMRGSESLSMHSYGVAIDIDPAHNAMGTRPTMPQWFVSQWIAAGFSWGGSWRKQDGMHFERLVVSKNKL